MDWDHIEQNWSRYRPLAREKWRRVPGPVLETIDGSRERLIEAIAESYEVSREQARREVNYWTQEAPRELERRMAEANRRRAPDGAGMGTRWMVQRGRRTLAMAGGQIQNPTVQVLLAFSIGALVGYYAARAQESRFSDYHQ